MKKTIFAIISVFILLGTSCENKWPRNGYLDGMWQVMTISHNNSLVYNYDDILSKVSYNPFSKEDSLLKHQIHYMSIQLDLFQLGNRSDAHKYYGYFKRDGNTIRFYKFSTDSKNETETDDNILIGDSAVSLIHPWGFYKTDVTFNILKLTEDDMILESDSSTITFRKF